MEAFRGMEVQLHTFLSSTVFGHGRSASCPSPLPLLPTEHKAGCEPELGWTLWSKQKSLPLQGMKPWSLSCPTCSLISTVNYAMLSQLYLLPLKSSRVNNVANFITNGLKKYCQMVQQCRSLGCTAYINWGTCGPWMVLSADEAMPELMIHRTWMWIFILHVHIQIRNATTWFWAVHWHAGQVPLQFIPMFP
jgi:hypothetical protein